MTTKQKIKGLARMYGISVNFDSKLRGLGAADYTIGRIIINPDNRSETCNLSTFFHELGHCYCYMMGKWKAYHSPKTWRDMTKEDILALRLTAYKAECWIEDWAEAEMGKLFPQLKYMRSYGTEASRKNLMKVYVDKWYKL